MSIFQVALLSSAASKEEEYITCDVDNSSIIQSEDESLTLPVLNPISKVNYVLDEEVDEDQNPPDLMNKIHHGKSDI